MPRYPTLSGPAQALPSSIFESLKLRLASFPGQVIPLHIGDTHLPPPKKSRLGSLGFPAGPDPDLYRYSPPPGKQGLLEALARKLQVRNRLAVTPDDIQITAGATHALSCAVRSVLDPGDQILLLAPYWPLIRGIALASGIRPVDVPFSHVLLRGAPPLAAPGEDAARPSIEELIERFITPQTAALYVCTPNNPDGKVLSAAELEQIARVAQRHDLWVLADEVYEDYLYDGRVHVSIASLPGMAERTVTVYSFSKSYGQAGLRVGYVVGPPGAAAAMRKMSNHSVYCVPRAMQVAALLALEHGAEFLDQAHRAYREARELAHGRMADLCLLPEGATYLWLDLRRFLGAGEEDVMPLLERLADAGVLLAPGAAFGHAFKGWARLCFTSVSRPWLEEGLDRVRRVLADSV
ncbi:MAG TPA: pyridoxal phosphate-dependent aminotransferase [Kofleriaceae bacterium]|nr:pyridoxal phosphate-dependent aminotransferase [Kofleriaceae bacterium]